MKLSEVSAQIKNRTKVIVRGQVEYSHIATKIAGEELARANSFTKFPSKDPYFKMSLQLTDANIQDAIRFDKNDQSETVLAAYIASRVYESKKEENKGKKFFSATSKGDEIRVYHKSPVDGKLHKVAINGNELAPGSNVELELNYFESKFGPGVGLNAVIIVDEQIKVFEGANNVKGYEVAEDTISLAPRANKVVDDVAAASDANETPVSDVQSEVEVDSEPIGSTSAPSNSAFDDLLAQFKAGGN